MSRGSHRFRNRELVARIQLLVCSVSVPLALVASFLVVSERTRIANLEARLLSEIELQEELLRGQPLDQTLFPHVVEEIGFVLNPYSKVSSFAAYEGDSYPVNSLGLRGAEISAKPAGTTRVLIVGDSIVFGWKLQDNDLLSSILNAYAARAGVSGGVEFVTVALPGWNVRSASAFVEHHIDLLAPDVILWRSPPNDVEDVPGVVPPGILAQWNSPQKIDEPSFAGLSSSFKLGNLSPLIRERRQRNFDLVETLHKKYEIPIVLAAFFGFEASEGFDPPRVIVPRKFRLDERWSLSSSDLHPTGWANRVTALAVWATLVEMKVVPEFELTSTEQDLVGELTSAIEQEKGAIETASSSGELSTWSGNLAEVATHYESDSPRQSVIYGVDGDGLMQRSGALLLRDPATSRFLYITVGCAARGAKGPRSLRVVARSLDRQITEASLSLDEGPNEVRLRLPPADEGARVYEVSWEFDYSECSGPSNCSSGELLRTRFGDGPA